MIVYILKGRASAGKTTWASEQENAIIVTRCHMHNIAQAKSHSEETGKNIIFDIRWTPGREELIREKFDGKAEVIVKEFPLPWEDQSEGKTIENEYHY